MARIPVPCTTLGQSPHARETTAVSCLLLALADVLVVMKLVLALVMGVAACAGDPADRPATWSYLHPAIIAPSCATSSCHSALVETAGIALDDREDSYTHLIELQFVVPGDPTSALIPLLEGDERPRMPPDAPLPQADIDLVRIWIENGAPQ